MLDQNAYPHIVNDIADAAKRDHGSALAIRSTCRRFRDEVDAALVRRLRIDRGPSPDSDTGDSDSYGNPVPGPLLILTGSGHRLPQLCPSSSPPVENLPFYAPRPSRPQRAILRQARVVDFWTNPKRSEMPELYQLWVDTIRFIGINDRDFDTAVGCRRMVSGVVVGLDATSGWGSSLLPGAGGMFHPLWEERFVANVVIPTREGWEDGLHMTPWVAPNQGGIQAIAFLLRPVDLRLAFGNPRSPRVEPDFGALFNVAILVLDIETDSLYTIVGIEDLSWAQIGVAEPSNGNADGGGSEGEARKEKEKETWFRAALEEMIVPVLGLERGMVNIDDIQSRIEFLSFAEYRARVGDDEYATDLIPLEGLLAEPGLQAST